MYITYEFQMRPKRHQNSTFTACHSVTRASFHSVNQLQKIACWMHQNLPFWAQKNRKIFSSDPSTCGKGTPHPLGASILSPMALDSTHVRPQRLWRLGSRDDCHGSYRVLATPVHKTPRPIFTKLQKYNYSQKVPCMQNFRGLKSMWVGGLGK